MAYLIDLFPYPYFLKHPQAKRAYAESVDWLLVGSQKRPSKRHPMLVCSAFSLFILVLIFLMVGTTRLRSCRVRFLLSLTPDWMTAR